jgi:hypothetical protein
MVRKFQHNKPHKFMVFLTLHGCFQVVHLLWHWTFNSALCTLHSAPTIISNRRILTHYPESDYSLGLPPVPGRYSFTLCTRDEDFYEFSLTTPELCLVCILESMFERDGLLANIMLDLGGEALRCHVVWFSCYLKTIHLQRILLGVSNGSTHTYRIHWVMGVHTAHFRGRCGIVELCRFEVTRLCDSQAQQCV